LRSCSSPPVAVRERARHGVRNVAEPEF